MGRTCQHCGSSEIDDDAARGDYTCMNCGMVLEESTIVSDVTYQGRSAGGSTLVGQFISHDHAQQHTLSGVPGLPHQEPREVTYMKGKKLIAEIANQLHINQLCIDTAYNFFRMCVCRNFTRGRVRSHVVAACLYMTCRLENTAHLLLDFSDVTQVNVFDLGRTLNFLARSLKINLPATDPCLYILRFAILLEFGEKEKEVVSLATRLVQRMKRDWIATGRRPTGLCGAALLLAARCYNFNRTIGDIVRVVHISETVVRRRLDEFGKTPSSELTIDEFTIVDLENCEDPPAFRESRRKTSEQMKRKEEQKAKEIELEVKPLEREVEKALERKRREKFKRTPYARMLTDSLVKESPELRLADPMIRNEIVEMAFDAGKEQQRPLTGISSYYAPTLESLGISDPLKPQPATSNHVGHSEENGNDESDLEEIDDDEIDTYILSREEAEMKSRLWMQINKEHLAEMELREEEGVEDEGGDDGKVKKKRKKSNDAAKKKEAIIAPTVQEAMAKVIQEKKLSNKIDYEILKEIMESEGNVMKSFYPTRAEMISSLGGDPLDGKNAMKGEPSPKHNCVSSSNTPTSQSNTTVLIGKRGSDDKNTVVRFLPRLARFKSSMHSNRYPQNLRSSPDVVEQEKQPYEGPYQHFLNCRPTYKNDDTSDTQQELLHVSISTSGMEISHQNCHRTTLDSKKGDIHEESSLLPKNQRELASVETTTKVNLFAERAGVGMREQEADVLNRAVENVSGEIISERNALRVSRSRYAKLQPNLASTKVKKKATQQPACVSFGPAGPSTADNLTPSATKIEQMEDLKKSGGTIPVLMQRDRKSGTVLGGEDPKILETSASSASRSRCAKVCPNVCITERIPSNCNTPASEQEDFNLIVTLEEDKLSAPKVVPSSGAEIQYPKARTNSRANERAALRNVGSTEKELYAPSDSSGRQLHSAHEADESTPVIGPRKRSAVAEGGERVGKGKFLGQLLDITGLDAMAALGRDSNSSCPRARIVHSSIHWTPELTCSSSCMPVDPNKLSSSQDPLKSSVSPASHSDRIINNLLAMTRGVTLSDNTAPGKGSSDVLSLSIVGVGRLNATLTPTLVKKQRRSNDNSSEVVSGQSSEAPTHGREMTTLRGPLKGTRDRYIKAKPNIVRR